MTDPGKSARGARIALQLTRQELCDLINKWPGRPMSVHTLRAWEMGERPAPTILLALMECLPELISEAEPADDSEREAPRFQYRPIHLIEADIKATERRHRKAVERLATERADQASGADNGPEVGAVLQALRNLKADLRDYKAELRGAQWAAKHADDDTDERF